MIIIYIRNYFYSSFLIAYLAFSGYTLLNARPSHVQHLQHLNDLHFNPQPKPAHQPAPLQNIEQISQINNAPAQEGGHITNEIELSDDNRPFLNVIKTALTPLLAHYYFEKIIPQDPKTTTLEDQLEYMYMISTFITRMTAQYNSFSEPVQEFIKTPFAQEQPLIKLVNKILICLQSFFAERMVAYKAIKPQTGLVKELKKIAASTAKDVDILCQKIVQLNPYQI